MIGWVQVYYKSFWKLEYNNHLVFSRAECAGLAWIVQIAVKTNSIWYEKMGDDDQICKGVYKYLLKKSST